MEFPGKIKSTYIAFHDHVGQAITDLNHSKRRSCWERKSSPAKSSQMGQGIAWSSLKSASAGLENPNSQMPVRRD